MKRYIVDSKSIATLSILTIVIVALVCVCFSMPNAIAFAEHEHAYSYDTFEELRTVSPTGVGADCKNIVLTATCSNDGCTLANSETRLKLSGTWDSATPLTNNIYYTYSWFNADTQRGVDLFYCVSDPTVKDNWLLFDEDAFAAATGIVATVGTISYDGTTFDDVAYASSSAPINAGEYTASVTVTIDGIDYDLSKEYVIDQISVMNIVFETNTYNGQEQYVFNAPEMPEGVEIYYTYDNGVTYTTDRPTAKNCNVKTSFKYKTTPINNPNYKEFVSTYPNTVQLSPRSYIVKNGGADEDNNERNMQFYLDGAPTTVAPLDNGSNWNTYCSTDRILTYDGQEHTFEIKIAGIGNDVITALFITRNAAGEDFRSVENQAIAADGIDAQNYFLNVYTNSSFCIKILKADYDMGGVVYNTEKAYNGEMQFLTVDNLPTGLDGIQLTASPVGNAATYPSDGEQLFTVDFATTSTNYNEPSSVQKTFSIVKKDVVVTLGDVGFYDGTAKLPAATFYGVEENESATVTLALDEDNVNAGEFDVTIEVDSAVYNLITAENCGYTVNAGVGEATLTILPRPIEVTISGATSVYGNTIATPVVTVTSNVNIVDGDDPWDYTAAYEALTATTTVSNGAVTVLEAVDPNYDISFVNNAYSITPKAITITADDKESVYGDSLFTLTATLSSKLVGEDEEADVFYLTKEFGIDVGEYDIAVISENNENYSVTAVSGEYTIIARPITVTIDDKTSVYGEKKVAISASITEGSIASGDDTPWTIRCAVEPYVYFTDVYNWGVVNAYAWYTDGGNNVSNTSWPGEACEWYETNDFGQNVYRYYLGGTNYENIIFNNGNGAQTADIAISHAYNAYYLDGSTVKSYKRDSGAGKYPITGTCINDNYDIKFVEGTYTINPRPVVVSGVSAEGKTYDGATDVTFVYTNISIEGIISGDELKATAIGAFANKNAGDDKTVVIEGFVFSGTDKDNYVADESSQSSISGVAISAKEVVVSGITAENKVYDGTTAATLNYSEVIINAVISGDDLGITATGSFASKNASESAQTVTISNVAFTGADAGNYALAADGQQTETVATISKRAIIVSGITKATYSTKEYDGTTELKYFYLNSGDALLDGKADGDDLTVTAEGVLEDVYPGENKTASISLTLGGDDVANYYLAADGQQTEVTGLTVDKRRLAPKISSLDDRVYNGTTQYTFEWGEFDFYWPHSMYTPIDDEEVGFSFTLTVTESEKNVGVVKTINYSAAELQGKDKDNYALDPANFLTQTALSFAITAKEITVTGITANDKVYDGTVNAQLNISDATLVGVVEGDDVSLANGGISGAFLDKNVTENKVVTVSGLTLSGEQAGNYLIASTTATATISPKEITVTGIIASQKTYDGTTAVSLTYDEVVLQGKVEGDDLTVTALGAFTNKNAGENKTVNITSIAFTGEDKDNYAIKANSQTTATATIAAKEISVVWTLDENGYVYSRAVLTLPAATVETGVENETVALTVVSDKEFKNAGEYALTAAKIEANDNYSLVNASKAVTVAKATFGDIVFEDGEFIYDGTAKYIEIDTDLNDEIIVQYANNGKVNVGEYTVTASFTVSDNYNAIADVTATLTINKATYDVSGITFPAVNAVYDGDAKTATISGDLPEGVTVSYENNSLVNVGSITATAIFDGDYDNYNAIANLTTTITVTKATYDVSEITFPAVNVVYDGDAKTATILGDLPEGVTVSYENNSLVNVGSITATAIFDGDYDNYNVIANMTTTITITKATYDISGITFPVVNAVYDGEAKTATISGELPEGVTVSYENNSIVNADSVTATAIFEGDYDNYNAITNMTTTVTISPLPVVLEWLDDDFTYDGEGHSMTATVTNAVKDDSVIVTAYTGDANRVNAGNYSISASALSNANYKLEGGENVSVDWSIAPREITVVYSSQCKVVTYGDVDGWITLYEEMAANKYYLTADLVEGDDIFDVISIDMVDGDAISVLATLGNTTSVGAYYLVATDIGNSNYAVTVALGDQAYLDVIKADYVLDVKFNDASFVYAYENGARVSRNISILGNLPDGVSVEYYEATFDEEVFATTDVAFTDKTIVGSYPVAAVFTGDYDNYNVIADVYATLTINPAPVTYHFELDGSVTIEKNVVYDGKEHTFNVVVDSVLGEDDLTFVASDLNQGAGVGAKEYVYSFVAIGEDKDNYDLVTDGNWANGVWTISPLEITVEYTSEHKEVLYGDEAAWIALGKEMQDNDYYLVGGVAEGDNILDLITVDLVDENGEPVADLGINTNAGKYDLKVEYNGNANYSIVAVNLGNEAFLVVNKATYDISGVSFNNVSVVYDGSEKSVLISGELPEGLTVEYANNSRTKVGETVATAIFVGDETNYYALDNLSAKLTITKATYDMSGISFNDLTAVYDGTAKSATVTGKLPKGVSVSYVNNTRTKAGVSSATANFSGDYENYYRIAYMTAKVTITKAIYDLSGVSFDNLTVVYDGEEKSVLISGELPSGLTVEYENNTLTGVGDIIATATFVGDFINHYEVDDLSAKLTITKATYDLSGVSFNDLTAVYDGVEKMATISGDLPEGVSVRYANNALKNAGKLTATASFTGDEDNYEIISDMTAVITVTAKPIVISADDKTSVYGNALEKLTATLSDDLAAGDKDGDVYSLQKEGGVNAGEYAIKVIPANNANYSLEVKNGVYKISPRSINVTAEDKTSVCGNSLEELTLSYDAQDLGYEDTIDLVCNAVCDVALDSAAGEYDITVVSAGNSNYTLTAVNGKYVLTEAPAVINEEGETEFVKVISEEAAKTEGADLTDIFNNAKAAEGENKIVTATIGDTEIVFDQAAIEKIAGKDANLKLVVSSENLEESVELELNVTLTGASFKGGKATVTTKLNKAIPAGMVGKVYYVAADGVRTDMKATFADGKVSFDTDHFSRYIVVFEKVATDSESKGGLSTGVLIATAAGAVVILIIIVIIIASASKKKKRSKTR